MRRVYLDGRFGPHPDAGLAARLALHLLERLREYEEDGIHPAGAGAGEVCFRVDGMPARLARQRLEQMGVYSQTGPEGVRLLIGPGLSFEDIDYVQSAAAALLDGA